MGKCCTPKYGIDFMITPVPYDFWPTVGRFVIRLWHESKSLERVAECISRHNANIITAECNRSGHRYATWHLTVNIEKLKNKDLEYDEKQYIYPETLQELKNLESFIYDECDEVLFRDENDLNLQVPIEPIKNCALSYFHNYWKNACKANPDSNWCHDPFNFIYRAGKIICTEEQERLDKLYNKLRHPHEIFPSITFCEMDWRDVNIRTVIIPQRELPRFFTVTINYKRSKGGSSKGLLAFITKELPNTYNMWRVYNQTKQNSAESEHGMLHLIVENTETLDYALERAKKDFNRFSDPKTNFPDALNHIVIEQTEISPITAKNIKEKLDRDNKAGDKVSIYDSTGNISKEIDIFISYCRADHSIAKDIALRMKRKSFKVFYAEGDVPAGVRWEEFLKRKIRESKIMCVICTPNTSTSQWVSKEVGAAWMIDIPIIPLTVNIATKDISPDLRVYEVVRYELLDKFLKELKSSLYKED
jgi:hypothetical protein